MDRFVQKRPRISSPAPQPQNEEPPAAAAAAGHASQTEQDTDSGDEEDAMEPIGGEEREERDESETANDISQGPGDGPNHPRLKQYPSRCIGTQQRSFIRGWFDTYSWIEYSVDKDAAYCFACRHFLGAAGQRFYSEPAFTAGYKDWKNATKAFKKHNGSVPHRFAMEAWAEFKITAKDGNRLCNMIDTGHAKLVKENREYMAAVVKSLRYTACQGIAQRGHREGEDSENKGNFLEVLNLISEFDTTVAKKLKDNPQNAKYTHKDIQNEIFQVMADMVRNDISAEIREAECFALLVDETKDVSKCEQLSVVVRYLRGEEVREEFLHFKHTEGLDADSLLRTIKQTLSQCNIDLKMCVGQCYDGAAVMSGCKNGVQQKLKSEVPEALYIHCHAHRLNLVLVDVVRNVEGAADFFETVQMLYNFFANSVAHDIFLKKQREMEPTSQPVELKPLSETRWSCQYASLVAIRKSLPALQATLSDIMSQSNARRRMEAKAVSGLIDEKFILLLTLFEDLFRITKFMSDQLQSPSLELSSTVELADSVMKRLSDRRTDESWRDIRDRASDLCTKANVTPSGTPVRRQPQPPRHLQGFVVEARIEGAPVGCLEALRTECFYPVIDRLLVEMKRRFSTEAGGVVSGVSALNPQNPAFLEMKCLQPMAKFYGVTEENLTHELHQVKRLLGEKKRKGHEPQDTAELLVLMRPYKDAFPDIHRLLCISRTLPVSSAGCERSFSCLRRIKNYLRNSSGDERNSNLGLLAINRQRSRSLDVQQVIDIFASNHNNRRIMLH